MLVDLVDNDGLSEEQLVMMTEEELNKSIEESEEELIKSIEERNDKLRYLWEPKSNVYMYFIPTKGQIISKCPFGVSKPTKKPTKKPTTFL